VTAARRGARGLVVALLVAAAGTHAAELGVPGTTTRVIASGWVDGLAIGPLGGPRQRPQALTSLTLLGKITPDLRTQLTLRGRAGGPFEGGHQGIMNFVHEFQNTTPSLDFNEAWAELRVGDGHLRAGIQKFAWGKLDGVPPTDVLTPRDFHDPLVRDVEESKVGIPAVQLGYPLPPVPALDLSELRATFVYVPLAVPPRLALIEERWFPPSISEGGSIRLSERQAERLVNGVAQQIDPGAPFIDLDGPVDVPVTFRTANHRPPLALDAGGLAVRLAGTVRGMDWAVSHYTGPETGPDATLEAFASCRDCLTAIAQGRLPVRARSFLRQQHDRIHMTGVDWAAALGGATVRAEVAIFQDRPYLRIASDVVAQALTPRVVRRYAGPLVVNGKARVPLQDLFPERDSVEWGIGADYLIGDFLPLLQVNQVVFTDHGPAQLLSNPETRILASLRHRFLQETLEVELRSVYAFTRGAWFVYPRASYRWGDHWRFRFGYLGIGGPLESVIGQFHQNDEFVMEARYSF
jgi:hypothetical protein